MEHPRTIKKIDEFVHTYIDPQTPDDSISLLQALIESNMSITLLGSEIGINKNTLSSYLRNRGVSTPSREDPEYRARQAEGAKLRLGKLRHDPEYISKQAESTRSMLQQRWQDPAFRARIATSVNQNWQDPEFRTRQADGSRQRLGQLWQDPEFRTRKVEDMKRHRQDPDFMARQTEALREARLDPHNIGRYPLPTIFGERADIGFAQSTWEANLARVILSIHRLHLRSVPLEIVTPEEYLDTLGAKNVTFFLDFLTFDNRGQVIAYEIMAHPKKNPTGRLKLELAINQYPDIIFKPITSRIYTRLQKRFAYKINHSPEFCGWETRKDNLKKNPTKWLTKTTSS